MRIIIGTDPLAQTIPEIRRVLVATDFSALGNQAVPYADATLSSGGAVKLIHVIPPWELPGPHVPHYERKRLMQSRRPVLVVREARS